MRYVVCPSCGARYAREKIGARTKFGCGKCHAPIVVPHHAPLTVVEPIAEAADPVPEPLLVVEPLAAADPTEPAESLAVVEPIAVAEPLTVVEPLPAEGPGPLEEPLSVVEPMALAESVAVAEPLLVVAPAESAAEAGGPSEGGEPQARTPRIARTARAPAAAARKRGIPAAAWALGAMAVTGTAAALVILGRDAAPDAPRDAASPAAEAPRADPMTDAAAWKALPAARRAELASEVVAGVVVSDAAAVRSAADLLGQRDETDAVRALAERVVAASPDDAWANAALGREDVAAEVDACLKRCEMSEDEGEATFTALREERERNRRTPWWVAADDAKRLRGLVAAALEVERRLASPYLSGVDKWVRWQRAIPVMKDYPSLHATTGPYVIFVCLNTSDQGGAPTLDRVRDATPEEIETGKQILERNRKLFTEFYDAWMREMGPILSLTRYGPENCDERTLMKANVFRKAEDYNEYNKQAAPEVMGLARAYYSPMEPRFITTYHGGGETADELVEIDQTQCHEAVHQLVHFYTWDLTRKDIGRDPDWLECAGRMLWSGEGFAEFFSAHRVVDGKYVWMQPLEERMRQIWTFEEIVREKGWQPWRLKEFFSMRHGGDLEALGSARAKLGKDFGLATTVMANLFYGKAWSFVHFLWWAEEDGKPKYRDRYVKFIQKEFHLTPVEWRGKWYLARPDSGDFLQIMGWDDEARLAEVEKEWAEFERKLLEREKKPSWDEHRKKFRVRFEIDPDPDAKGEKPEGDKPK